ncbi:MAG TPA: protoporphyrinogen oxidase [Candidatus Acidoferrum sp.]|nr:protoporphyrinogen oxidase [Candidatus Acidoferrum sp.]
MVSSALTVVVGAGISGLTCAYALQKAGHSVLTLEATSRPGGMIQSIAEDGYVFETGPQSFSSTPALDQLTGELGLMSQLLEGPRAAPRFVLVDRELVAVPMSPPGFLASRLFGWKTKSAILTEVLRSTRAPDPDESIAAFTRRKFTAELLDRLVGPFVSGIYAGDPEQISLRAAFPRIYEAEQSAGSVVRGMFRAAKSSKAAANRRPALVSLRPGNAALTSALAAKLGTGLRYDVAVRSIAKTARGFTIRAQSGRGLEELPCERVVLASPAHVAASLLAETAPEAANSLLGIAYAPVAVVSLAYRREHVRHTLNGFGFLVPRSAAIRTLGTVWNSSQFGGRAPSEHVLLTSFVGGTTDREAVNLSDNELSAIVHRELTAILGISGQPVKERVSAYPRAIPQYNLGHIERLQVLRGALLRLPGLWLAGNYLQGPAVGACIGEALSVAEQVRISYNS